MQAVILFVEDNDYVRESVAELLEGPTRRFVCCSRVDEALAVLEREPVDLVITDLNLPGAPGMDLVRASLSSNASRPVIICSGHDMSRAEFTHTDAVVFVRKPFELEELEGLVDRLLGEQGPAERA